MGRQAQHDVLLPLRGTFSQRRRLPPAGRRGGPISATQLVVALSIFCFILAALMGLTTPNLGTLSRNRSGLLPFFLLLLLQNDYAATLLRYAGLNPTKKTDAPHGNSPALPVA